MMLKVTSVATLLGASGIRRAVLEAFADRPGESVHGREMARRLGASQPAVSRVMNELQRQRVLVAEMHGREKIFTLAHTATARHVLGILESVTDD